MCLCSVILYSLDYPGFNSILGSGYLDVKKAALACSVDGYFIVQAPLQMKNESWKIESGFKQTLGL